MKWPGQSVWARVSDPSKPSEARQCCIRWLKFNLVGGIGIGVQLAALAICRAFLHFHYLLATALSVEVAVLHNFLWHERFTWADRPTLRFSQSFTRLVRFHATNGAVSMLGNLLLMRLLVGELRLNYISANVLAISVCSMVNFLLSDRFVFEREANSLKDDGNVTLAQ